MRLITEADTYQIMSDGITVWVNSANGMCIGRFSPAGVDIHMDAEGQMATGQECLDCYPRTSCPVTDWDKFVTGMLHHYGITVSEKHRPISKRAWLQGD